MDEIRILFKLIALAISLVSVIMYYSSRRKTEAVSNEKRRELEPLRRLTEAELLACRTVYRAGKKLVSGTEVFSISGYHRTEEIKIKNSSRVIHFMDSFRIEWISALESAFVGESRAEVAFTPDGTGLILSLNEKFSVCEESSLIQLIRGGDSAHGQVKMKDAVLETRNRDMSRFERAYRRFDLRISASILAGASLVIPYFFPGDAALAAAGAVLCLSLILLVFPRGVFGYRPKKLYTLRGAIEKNYAPGGGTLRLGRFSLVVPPHWIPRISTGFQATLAGYPRGKGFAEFVVLSAGDSLSVDEDERKRRSFRYGRFALAGSVFFACLVFQSILVNPSRTITKTINWLETRGLPVEFEGYAALTAGKPGEGRAVSLTGLRVVPERLGYNEYDSSWMIVSPDARISPDFSGVQKRIRALADLQMTEEALGIRILSADDMLQYYAIALKLVPSVNGRRIGDYAETFGDNPDFAPLVSRIDEYLAESGEADPESSDDGEADSVPMCDAFDAFMDTEMTGINEAIGAALEVAVEGVPRVSISNSVYEYTPYPSNDGDGSPRYAWLAFEDVSPYMLSTDPYLTDMDDAYALKDSLGADAVFASVEAQYQRGANAAVLAGIITEASWNGEQPSIRLEIGDEYADMDAVCRRIAVFSLTAVLCLICAGVAAAGVLYTSRRNVFLSGNSRQR